MINQPGGNLNPSLNQKPNPSEKKENTNRKWIMLSLIILLVFCLCCVNGGTLLFNAFQKAAQEQPNVLGVVDTFMQKMEAQDLDGAYAKFSSRAQNQFKLEDLENYSDGAKFVLFDRYQDIEVRNINFKSAFNSDPNQPQGEIVEFEGLVIYDYDFTGSFTAVLEKEDAVWRTHNFNVIVSPDKFENYYEDQDD